MRNIISGLPKGDPKKVRADAENVAAQPRKRSICIISRAK